MEIQLLWAMKFEHLNAIRQLSQEDVVEFFDVRQWKRSQAKAFSYEVPLPIRLSAPCNRIGQ